MYNFTEMDSYLFGQGTHYEIFKKMGAHPMEVDGVKGVMFTVWAPHATAVSVIGEFNQWDEEKHMMRRVDPVDVGVYERFVPKAKVGQLYKFLIHTADGRKLYKADPYASYA